MSTRMKIRFGEVLLLVLAIGWATGCSGPSWKQDETRCIAQAEALKSDLLLALDRPEVLLIRESETIGHVAELYSLGISVHTAVISEAGKTEKTFGIERDSAFGE